MSKTGVKGKTVPALARKIGADKRFAARAQRSTEDQLKLLDTRPGASQKERIRLGYILLRDDPEMREITSERPKTRRTRRRAVRNQG